MGVEAVLTEVDETIVDNDGEHTSNIWKARENIVQLQKQFTTDKLNVQLQNTSHNNYFICTSAKLYVGIIHSFSTSAKQKAQLLKTNGTTAKQIVQLKKCTMAIFLCPHDRVKQMAGKNLEF
jgi:hypothetical protein